LGQLRYSAQSGPARQLGPPQEALLKHPVATETRVEERRSTLFAVMIDNTWRSHLNLAEADNPTWSALSAVGPIVRLLTANLPAALLIAILIAMVTTGVTATVWKLHTTPRRRRRGVR